MASTAVATVPNATTSRRAFPDSFCGCGPEVQCRPSRHAKVGDYGLEGCVQFGYGLETVGCGFNDVTFSAERRVKSRQHLNIVVNYK
jgi:hypothetical protein